jgi:hypothetical protein
MPWPAAMRRPDMPRAVDVDWWRLTASRPEWVHNRFAISCDRRYVDAVLASALEKPDTLDPKTFCLDAIRPGARLLMILQPDHYTAPDVSFFERPATDPAPWVADLRNANHHDQLTEYFRSPRRDDVHLKSRPG